MELILKPIAILDSCYRDRFAVPRQPLLVEDSWSFIRLKGEFQPELSLKGLEGYSHLWIIFGFHLNKSSHFHAKVHPPRLEGETMGLFATRTPHRPNPIGLSLVAIKKITTEGIEITGADLADGTPIYDIKPYLPEVEALPEARGGWSSQISKPKIPVIFESEELEQKVIEWGQSLGQNQIKRLIIQTLEEDPRPLVYKKMGQTYKESHAFRLFNGDIHFKFNEGSLVVFNLLVTREI